MTRLTALIASLALGGFLASAQTGSPPALLPDLESGRWGISIKALDGADVLSVNAEDRFVPASTMKLVTTAAAFHYLGGYHNGGWPRGTAVYLKQAPNAALPNLVIVGSGDATLSTAPSCTISCLGILAEAVEATGVTQIQDIEVNDSLFVPPYWPPGWSHEDLRFGYGTAISALSADDAIARATITPGIEPGMPPILEWVSPEPYRLETDKANTVSTGFGLELEKRPAAPVGEVTGSIGARIRPVLLELGLDDPSLQVGRLFGEALKARGIETRGTVVRTTPPDEAAVNTIQPQLIHRLPPPDPRETLREILHESNNLHAEILLHHVSLTLGDRTTEAGIDLMEHLLLEAGAQEGEFNISDGSGLSFYNRLSPNALSDLLVWAASQPWYEEWSGLLAESGQDGTLEYRLSSRAVGGTVRAKSGTVFGADALAGYFTARSGRTFAFAVFINDSALSHAAARARIDDLIKTMIDTY